MSEHNARHYRRKLGQDPIKHINGAAGMRYGATVRCGCGWAWSINVAPSSGGRKACEAAHAAHVEEEADA